MARDIMKDMDEVIKREGDKFEVRVGVASAEHIERVEGAIARFTAEVHDTKVPEYYTAEAEADRSKSREDMKRLLDKEIDNGFKEGSIETGEGIGLHAGAKIKGPHSARIVAEREPKQDPEHSL